MSLPSTMKGIVLHEDNSLTLETSLPFPSATHGSAVVHVLATHINPNLIRMVREKDGHGFTQPRPLIPGSNAIGRVVAVGVDSTVVKPGQLVAVEAFVRARDDPDVQILWGMHDGMTPETKKLHADGWRNGAYAEYVRAPLENTHVLNEELLCGDPKNGGFGYSIHDLIHLIPHGVPYAGLRSINLQAGETVVISPATGLFSGSAINAALSMGANVVAVSRSASGLEKVKQILPSVRTVTISGNNEADTAAIVGANGGRFVDAFLDLSPPAATGTTSITACMLAVRSYGHICLMGGRSDANVPIPWPVLLYRNLTIKGGFMYEREEIRGLIRLFESGHLKLGKENGFEVKGVFKLEDWEAATEAALQHHGFGQVVVLSP